MSSCLIIAEAGVNHNGSEELAFQLVDAAVDAGADIVKFQTFKAANLATHSAEQSEYQVKNTGVAESQYAMLKKLELSEELHFKLQEYCDKKGIEFLSTAFDHDSLHFLVNRLGLRRLKIPSGEITNAPLVLAHATAGCELIMSTGMATLSEIEMALGVLAFGLLGGEESDASVEAFQLAYASAQGQKILREKVSLLHCVTEYPVPVDEMNINAIPSLAQSFQLKVGYSDHSEGVNIPLAARALGASVIEKHFTMSRNLPGPDHKASLEPEELKYMVSAIREVERAMGTGVKHPQPCEIKNIKVARKSLVTTRVIKKGEIFRPDMIAIKRPGGGQSPFSYWQVLGTKAPRDYSEDEVL